MKELFHRDNIYYVSIIVHENDELALHIFKPSQILPFLLFLLFIPKNIRKVHIFFYTLCPYYLPRLSVKVYVYVGMGKDIYRYVYNARGSGKIEYQFHEENDKEIALKHTAGDKPFALIKIGSVRELKKDFLQNYMENEVFEDPRYFDRLNEPDSSINLLIGSRAFYEGWDSSRPNIIVFINIGTQASAQKFVLQAVGRGVRIQPVNNERQRLKWCAIRRRELLEKISEPSVKALESLFVFATSRKAVETILKELQRVKEFSEWEKVEFYKNPELNNKLLLVPKYSAKGKKVYELSRPPKFRLSEKNYELLKLYFNLVPAERFVLEWYATPEEFEKFKEILNAPEKYLQFDDKFAHRTFERLVNSFISYIRADVEELDEKEPITLLPDDVIVHFKEIKVNKRLVNVEEFIKVVKEVYNAREMSEEEKDNRMSEYRKQGKTFEKAYELVKIEASLVRNIDGITLEKILNHYYIPVAYARDRERLIRHVITVASEIEFISALKNKIGELNELCEYWFFSKIEESKDRGIYIPYIDKNGKPAKFIPDFIFWFKPKQANRYIIYFIDPKGKAHTDYELKVDGYERIFTEKGEPKKFQYNHMEVEVRLKLFSKDASHVGEKYGDYWTDETGLFEDLFTS